MYMESDLAMSVGKYFKNEVFSKAGKITQSPKVIVKSKNARPLKCALREYSSVDSRKRKIVKKHGEIINARYMKNIMNMCRCMWNMSD